MGLLATAHPLCPSHASTRTWDDGVGDIISLWAKGGDPQSQSWAVLLSVRRLVVADLLCSRRALFEKNALVDE
jgi:hypothetical protein